MQGNLTRFCAQSDIVHDLWKPAGTRKRSETLGGGGGY